MLQVKRLLLPMTIVGEISNLTFSEQPIMAKHGQELWMKIK